MINDTNLAVWCRKKSGNWRRLSTSSITMSTAYFHPCQMAWELKVNHLYLCYLSQNIEDFVAVKKLGWCTKRKLSLCAFCNLPDDVKICKVASYSLYCIINTVTECCWCCVSRTTGRVWKNDGPLWYVQRIDYGWDILDDATGMLSGDMGVFFFF